MPRIDPNQLLKCLSVLLSPSGGIKSKEEVQRLASLMTKFSKKLVSKCIYVLILKSTEADLLDMFMSAGGWDLTFNWLSDGIQMKNWPLVAELVELLLLCPVDIERLKGNNCPKVIKVLSKDPSATDRVRQLACSVVDQWLTIVKGACEASNTAPTGNTDVPEENNVDVEPQTAVPNGEMEEDSNDATTPRGVYKITIRDGKNVLAEVISSSDRAGSHVEDKVEDEEEVKEEKSSEEKRSILKVVNDDPIAKESLPPKKLAEGKKQSLKRKNERRSSPELEKKSSKEKKKITPEKKTKLDLKSKTKKASEKSSEKSNKDKEKTPEEKAQEEKDKQNLMKLITPSIGGLGKIPKKSKDDSKKEEKKSSGVKPPADPKKPFPKDPKKYNISIETRKGEDRPKTVKTFNSKFRSTGLEELPPPPKSSKKKEEVVEKKSLKRASPTKEVQPPEKKAKEEEKLPEKPILPVLPPSTKPKISGLQESDVFADALTAANLQKDVKKRKRRPSVSNSPGDSKKENSTTKTEEKDGKEAVKPVLKFYQDTLITSEEKVEVKAEKIKEESTENASDDTVPDENITDALTKEELEDEVAKAEEAIDQVLKMEEKKNVEREKNRLPKGVLVYVRKYSKVKKSVKWKSEKELESIQYFELDETERVNVTKPFMDMKQMERINERILLSRKLVSEDIMEEKTPWRPLIPIDISGDLVIPGKNSIEKDIQRARERTTLLAIYFNRSLIPDSPAEPDLEIHAATDPAIIPLKDLGGNVDSVLSYRDKPWPEPKGYPPGSAGSPPQMSPPSETAQPPMHGMPLGNMYPQQQFQHQPMQPYMPSLMGAPEWMGNNEGNNMMVGGMPGPNDPMMMGPTMTPGMQPGLLPPPDMYHMGGPPPHPDFMAPPFPMAPPPGMYQNGPANYPPHQDPGPRHQRPWFRGGGGNNNNMNNSGGSWRHQSKSSWNQNNGKMCKFYVKKGICRQNNCTYRHGSGKGNIR